jgi:hypothetical protein
LEAPKATLERVSQTIDLNEIVGSDISKDEKLVTKIGQSIIDYMEQRVEDGLGYGRKKLKSPYSKSYASSLDFTAAGKSKNHVNMRLSGDMLASIDIVETNGAKVTIAIEGDQAPKAFNHQTGDTLPKREFFGVTKDEVKKYILEEFKSEIEAKKVTSAQGINQAVSAIRGIRTLADFFGA